MVEISNLISLDRIKILNEHQKEKALKEIIQMFSRADTIKDAVELEKAIFERESIMSTSIGLGVAIPHVRLKSVIDMTMAIGISKEGVDYKAFDDQKVNIIIMIAAPEGTHREYLRILAKIALLLKNVSIRDSIIDAQSTNDIYNILKDY